MDIANIISKNLADWMATTPGLDTLQKVEAKSGIGFGTVRRTRNGDGNITVEKLTAIAAAFGRTPAELLTPKSSGNSKPAPLEAIPSSTDPAARELWLSYCAASERAQAIVDAALGRQHAGADPNDPLRSVVSGLLTIGTQPLADGDTRQEGAA